MTDILSSLLADLNAIGKSRMQHLRPEHLAEEAARLVKYAEDSATSKQLAKYGVSMYSIDLDQILGDSK